MEKKKVALLDIESNPNIGLYMFANDKFCLIGPHIPKVKHDEIEKVLGVPIYKLTALGTDLIGIFFAGNNDILIVPELYDYEEKELEKITKKHGVELIKTNTRLNTLGNNICVGEDILLFNPEYSKAFMSELKKKTKYDVLKLDNEEFSIAGAVAKSIGNMSFVSQELEEKQLGKFLKSVKGAGTINSGSNMVASGIVGNKNGLLLGSMSSTVEIQNVVESLDYL